MDPTQPPMQFFSGGCFLVAKASKDIRLKADANLMASLRAAELCLQLFGLVLK
jgi:hypothetical protein